MRATFAGTHPEVDEWLGELARTPTFYFDSITQLQLDSWSRGPGDARRRRRLLRRACGRRQYEPRRPGGLRTRRRAAIAGGDHERAYPAYECEMGELVRRSRAFARGVAKTLIPSSPMGVRALVGGARLLSALPTPISRAIAKVNTKGLRLHDSMSVKDYA